jgi:hypothetical protein
LVLVLRLDGTLAALTVDPANGVTAWTELITQGFIWDIATYYSTVTNQDELYAQISYNYTGAQPPAEGWNIERMPYPSRTFTPYGLTPPPFPFFTETLTEQGVICMDSWVRGTLEIGDNNVITGLHYSNGTMVGVLVNDAWTGTYEVTDGTVTLEDVQISPTEPYEGEYAVGLMQDGKLKTFEVAEHNPRGVGFGTKRKWTELTARLLDSALPRINGQLPDDRPPATPMGVPETVRMGIRDVTVTNLGWGDGAIDILQDRPYPTQILGFFGKLEVDDA